MYLKFPDHHGPIQTQTAVLLHFGFIPRNNTQLPAGPTQHYTTLHNTTQEYSIIKVTLVPIQMWGKKKILIYL